ncbi:2OG-Fe(II) oxygenase [Massilia sp. LXY-6]|uniref:2OG-Fe(II) oxygenase n=1 Tax=Massilia sp. LXY-6 TaxID=3379823 RepID=UPI003EE00965
MSSATFSSAALAAVLRTIRRHGDYFTSGTAEIAAPNLSVAGLGMVSLPFQHSQLAPLLAKAELAPFGRDEQTMIDTAVRRTWQIDAGALSFGGRNWQRSLDTIVARASDGLGVQEPVRAELYKLLIYDTGSFFVEHRDTEKAAGMFATLVLILPSLYTGGELLVRHKGREVRLDLGDSDPGDAAFAAFYADCVHEVLPVTSGARLTLVYNLIRNGARGPLSAPEHGEEVGAVAELLQDWIAAQDAGIAPDKLVYPLEHAYSMAELGFDTLKNVDAAVAQVLTAAAAKTGCELHLALLEITESGSAEEGGYYYDDQHNHDGDFDIVEVFDHDATLANWRAVDGSVPPLGALPLLDDELCPAGAFDNAEPDESHFHEATGNEGASFDRAYRRAALVLWPRGRRAAVIGAAPLAASLPYLEHLVEDWRQHGAQQGNRAWRDACELADVMVGGPEASCGRDGLLAARLLISLVRLRHTTLIDTYLVQMAASGRFRGAEARALADAALLLPPQRAGALIEAIVAANVSFVPGPCAELVSYCSQAGDDAHAWLAPATCRLVDALLGRYSSPRQAEQLRLPAAIDTAAVVAALSALRDAGLAEDGEAVVEHWMATCPLDGVLVGAAQAVASDPGLRLFGPSERLRSQVRQRIEERIAQPLTAPCDWRRASKLPCSCEYCAQLAQFLTTRPVRAGH